MLCHEQRIFCTHHEDEEDEEDEGGKVDGPQVGLLYLRELKVSRMMRNWVKLHAQTRQT